MLSESIPDNTLLWVKDVAMELNETENMVKLYSLSNDRVYLKNYKTINQSLDLKFEELQKLPAIDSSKQILVDSVLLLAQQKIVIWEKILNLHLSKGSEHEAFNEYVETLDTVLSVQDTIHFQEPEKRGLLKRIFGKKQAPPTPVIVDRTPEKQRLQQELEELEKELAQRSRRMSTMEAVYMRKNLEISESLVAIITALELMEEEHFLRQSQQAELLANETYKRLLPFALSVFLLLMLVLLLFFRDLRKSRSYQNVLRKAKAQAENLARTKELFVATVSHEMRTPVNAIYGLSEQLLQKQHDRKTQEDLRVIFDSTKHLADLVNDTFDFSRLEKQNIQLVSTHFSLHELLYKINLYNKTTAENKNISLHINNKTDNDLILYGDEGRLKQVLNNLISNAIKFTDEGSVRLKVEAKQKNETILLECIVSDTGIGIPKESQEKIFDEFVQLETDLSRKAGGTGLGLYIVKKLVDLLNGKITLESKTNVGTRFYISIPFKKGKREQLQHSFKSHKAPGALKDNSVLIADDEEFNRHLLKSIFLKWNVDFDEAENGQAAIEMAAHKNYRLILMDIRMPLVNGIDAADQIKASGHKARIIALSANTNNVKTKKQGGKVFDDALKKPFNEAALYEVISNCFNNIENAENLSKKMKPTSKFNLSELENMSNGDPAFVKEMIELFLKTSKSSIHTIEKHLNEKNGKSIAEVAHKLASPVKYMSATKLYNLIKALEKLAGESDSFVEIKQRIKEVKSEINKLNQELEKLISEKDE
ncbi:ATP-binding protein [uncultured Draconibacterium sp.]|uniref:ATP-binding protein n=1 Tax=uncultured Draconibacterium sp. TaxID=1573823 RepID=UPI0032616224